MAWPRVVAACHSRRKRCRVRPLPAEAVLQPADPSRLDPEETVAQGAGRRGSKKPQPRAGSCQTTSRIRRPSFPKSRPIPRTPAATRRALDCRSAGRLRRTGQASRQAGQPQPAKNAPRRIPRRDVFTPRGPPRPGASSPSRQPVQEQIDPRGQFPSGAPPGVSGPRRSKAAVSAVPSIPVTVSMEEKANECPGAGAPSARSAPQSQDMHSLRESGHASATTGWPRIPACSRDAACAHTNPVRHAEQAPHHRVSSACSGRGGQFAAPTKAARRPARPRHRAAAGALDGGAAPLLCPPRRRK